MQDHIIKTLLKKKEKREDLSQNLLIFLLVYLEFKTDNLDLYIYFC